MTDNAPSGPGIDAQQPSLRPAASVKRKPATSRKITRRLLVLSSTAILSVYAAGYLRTESAAEQIAAAERPSGDGARPLPVPTQASLDPRPTPAAAASIPTGGSAAPAEVPPTSTPVPPTSTPQVLVTAALTPTPAPVVSGFRDGKYVGLGRSRHGSIQATVVIQGGKIVSASISRCGTRYPCSRIASLPDQVVAQQNTDVDLVSGASDSSDAYLEAVSNALAQAS